MAHMYLRFLDMYFYFLSALVRHTIYIYIPVLDESFVTYDDVLFCVMRLSNTFCDLMYEIARHSTHGFLCLMQA